MQVKIAMRAITCIHALFDMTVDEPYENNAVCSS